MVITALLLCAFLTAFALSDSALTRLWRGGTDLLFHTDNVTVTGEMTFALDGETFKTAQLNYIQDGYSSYYGLKLLTPQKSGDVQETGWTIIADKEGSIAVMEAYTPGVYRMGLDTPQNTLLRRSVQLDALAELGGLLVGPVESLLPEGAVTLTEADGETKVHLLLKEGEVPALAASALNNAAGFLSDRWFSWSHDRAAIQDEYFVFDHYVTVTEALTDGTVNWALKCADLDFALDAQGRMTAASGELKVASTFWDGTVREITMKLDLNMTAYGESTVKPFDPADYGVELQVWEDYDAGEEAPYGAEYEEDMPAAEVRPTAAPHDPMTITAMAAPFNPNNMASLTVNARILGYDAEKNELKVDLLTQESFSRDEVLSLAVGDAIYTQGREVKIETLEGMYGYLIINDPEYAFTEDSVWLFEQMDGNFGIANWDDVSWVTVATLNVPVQDGLLLLDNIDPATGESLYMPTVHSAAEFVDMVKAETEGEGPAFATNNVYAVFDAEGRLAVVERFYVPWQ